MPRTVYAIYVHIIVYIYVCVCEYVYVCIYIYMHLKVTTDFVALLTPHSFSPSA